MPSSATFLKVTILTSMLMAHGAARAGEDEGAAMQEALAHAATADEPRPDASASYPQARQDIPAEIELVTGDGQQATAASRSVVCGEQNAECKP